MRVDNQSIVFPLLLSMMMAVQNCAFVSCLFVFIYFLDEEMAG